ncbi:MAG: PocR ligand-binding domain-containing protein [Acidobacteriaceae bacterium]|nr:PocR ligand-binding domain-containing protein [Acidobacteriaceae bacterium]MBV9499279.1 PocR ligand-binding domain-containing protein [Acidobacteriaceae bacterium]
MKPSNELPFRSGVWQTALEKYATATGLTVNLYDAGGRPVLGPIHPTPLFELFDENGYDPGIFAECVRRCLAQTRDRPAVVVSQVRGLAAVGISLVLEGNVIGAAVGGYVFRDFSQSSEIQALAREAGIAFDALWSVARKQPPVPQSRLIVHGELLQVLGDALLEREELICELKRSNDELSRFSYAVSHDLQAPVRTVQCLTELVARGSRGKIGDSEAQMLDMVVQAADGMHHLIEALLAYAHAGNAEISREAVPVGAAVDDVRSTLAGLITEADAQILSGPLPTIEADRVQLTLLLQNLVANAINYHRAEEPPVIEISGELAHGEWQFAVKDNGQGIPRHLQGEIFKPLKRLHGKEIPGTGLGLALCRTVVERHGGRIWVESEGAGRGATFYFTLPARRRPTNSSEAQPCIQAQTQSP